MDHYWIKHQYYYSSVEDGLKLNIYYIGVENGLVLDHSSIFMMGHSAGSHIAVEYLKVIIHIKFFIILVLFEFIYQY